MNIWLIDHYTNMPQDLGDARQFSTARELNRLGHETRVIACTFNHLTRNYYPSMVGTNWSNREFDGVQFTVINAAMYQTNFEMPRLRNMFEFAWRVWRRKWAKNIELPHLILGSSPDPFVALAAERLAADYGVPFVLEIRDPWPYAIIEVAGQWRYHPFVVLVDWTMRYLYKRARRIVMLSKNSTDLLAEGGADPGKIVWIPQAVDLGMNPDPLPPPDDGVFTVTYLGAHNLWNSLETVLEAARILQEKGRVNIVFQFVGAGVLKASLMKQAKATGLVNVRFCDPMPKNQVHEVQHSSDAFIINNRRDAVSRRWMSFNKLYNYMAAGRPVVFGSYTENDPVRESGAGISVEAGSAQQIALAVERLAALPADELFAWGMKGRRFVEERYSIFVLATRFEQLAYEVTGLPRPGILASGETHSALPTAS
jgi:glycosyltransferase involved in cell wall biosynthesis